MLRPDLCVKDCELPKPQHDSERLHFGDLNTDVRLGSNVMKWLVKKLDESKYEFVQILPALLSDKSSGKSQDSSLRWDAFLGILQLGNYSIQNLMDSGAEANFVAKKFVDQNDLRRQKLRATKSAELPEGTVLEVTEIVQVTRRAR